MSVPIVLEEIVPRLRRRDICPDLHHLQESLALLEMHQVLGIADETATVNVRERGTEMVEDVMFVNHANHVSETVLVIHTKLDGEVNVAVLREDQADETEI